MYSSSPSTSILDCANIGGTEGLCGVTANANYDRPPNAIGGIMPPAVQDCYAPGSTVEFESVLTAHHKGTFVFHI